MRDILHSTCVTHRLPAVDGVEDLHLLDDGALAGLAGAEQEDLDDLAVPRLVPAQLLVDVGIDLGLGAARPAPHDSALGCRRSKSGRSFRSHGSLSDGLQMDGKSCRRPIRLHFAD